MLCLCTFASLLFNFQGSLLSDDSLSIISNRVPFVNTFFKSFLKNFFGTSSCAPSRAAVELQFNKYFRRCQYLFSKKIDFFSSLHFIHISPRNSSYFTEFSSFYSIYSVLRMIFHYKFFSFYLF